MLDYSSIKEMLPSYEKIDHMMRVDKKIFFMTWTVESTYRRGSRNVYKVYETDDNDEVVFLRRFGGEGKQALNYYWTIIGKYMESPYGEREKVYSCLCGTLWDFYEPER